MNGVREGDRIRVDIPDEGDPDHDRQGMIVDTVRDDAATETGEPRDATIYRVEFDDGSRADFRWRDIRPPIGEDV